MARWLRFAALSTLFMYVLAFTDSAQAIIYRHDVDADTFLLAQDEFPSVFEVVPGNGGATLIAPEWAVTAAHVTGQIAAEATHEVTLGGEAYRIVQVVVHPNWGGIHFDDIALLRLDRAVTNVLPTPLYTNDDELGQTLLILGWGDYGDGIGGARNAVRDGQFRGATNIVERLERGSLWVQFDAPDGPQPTPLEGVAGPGDSGGPAMIDVDGQYQLAGVASFGIEMGNPPPAPGTYGTFDTYTSISRNRDWIDDVLSGDTEAQVERDESAPNIEVVVGSDASAPSVEIEVAETLEEQETTRVSHYLLHIAIVFLIAIIAIIAGIRWRHGMLKKW